MPNECPTPMHHPLTVCPICHPVPADAPVEIPLPPEPPRTRVIEALDADGVVVDRWEFVAGHWRNIGEPEWVGCWRAIVGYAYDECCTLRHRAAEGATDA